MKKQQKFYKKSPPKTLQKKVQKIEKDLKKTTETIIYTAVKEVTSLHRLVIPPAILISVLFLMLTLYISLQVMVKQLAIDQKPYKNFAISPYPIVVNTTTPVITAQTAVIIDETANTILFERNSQFRFSMASTTKIMTALVGLSHYKLSDVLTVKRIGVEGASVGFTLGDQVRFEDVLYGLLLPSGNDAAYVIADNYPGGVDAFVAAMNAKASQLSLVNTHYGDPAGLNDDQNYTVVGELAHLANVAIKNPTLAKVVSTKDKSITTLTGHTYSFSNLNRLLGTRGVTGVKTGTTDGAGEVLVTSKVENGRTFIIIVMKSQNRFADTVALLDFISENVSYIAPQFPFLPTL